MRHDLPLRNPCCALQSKSFDSRKFISFPLISDFIILHGTDVKDTGR